MLNIPDPVKDLFKLDSCRKNFRVHFPNVEMDDLTNADMVQESVEFSESICSQSTFKFGLSESSTIQFETVGVGNMMGMLIDCGIEIDLSSLSVAQLAAIAAGTWDGYYVAAGDSDIGYGYFHVPYGRFTVRSCPRDHRAMTHRRVQAYTDTRFLESGFQKSLMDAKSFKNSYNPKFKNMFYSVVSTNNESILLSAGYERNMHIALSSIIDSNGSASQVGYVDLVHFGSFDFKLEVLAKNFRIYGAGDSDYYTSDAIYGIDGLENISNENLVDTIASVLVSDYQVPESDAYNYNIYDPWKADYVTHSEWNSIASVLKPKIIGLTCFAELNGGSTIWHENPYESIASANGLYCINPDRDGLITTISVLSSISLTPWEGDLTTGHATGDAIVSSATGLNEAYINQYLTPNGSEFNAKLKLKSTGSEKVNVNGAPKLYTFSGAIDSSKLIADYLELNALFAAQNRNGGFRVFSLDDSNPVTLTQNDYSAFWWDEYDVSPIGKIKYKLTKKEKEEDALYDFGSGQSVYNMTDNTFFKEFSKTQDEIESIFESSFVPHTTGVQFTPIEIVIGNGLPYLEAGDCIHAVSEDGVTALSYNLVHTISGIQHLTETMESNGGDLMSSTEVI